MNDQPNDPWLIAEADSEGQLLIFRIREAVPENVSTAGYPHVVNIVWPYESDESGMPPDDIDELQNAFEDRLSVLEDRRLVWLMVVVTGDDAKEWFCYVGDIDSFMRELNGVVADLPALPIEIQAAEDPEWNTWAEFVADLRQE